MKPMTRKELLKTLVRGGVLAAMAGIGFALGSREKKFECSTRCGKCVRFENGKCGLGLK